ncbi:simple sugar transport system ATP-binding protein [Thermanaeromonas toyohensis ToBE]|uniref:Simple sugar transport system ATP-binding protein n=1 Tax=Thermanaeromonas toyohensis ToBE TaxID=698762 RepID=A0A1W1W2Q9_9FIRM|nr:simple sugar transport system ATP-binding protein [Thermanaeromonas toyohensis ToBE]
MGKGGVEVTAAQPVVQLSRIWKRFGTVQALADASFEAFAGEIHVILGENGAGKTSLMSVLAGFYRPDRGEIRIYGKPVVLRSPRDAVALGIAMVHQHFEQIQNMTVWENTILGCEDSLLFLNPRYYRKVVQQAIAKWGIEVDGNARVDRLPIGQQQKVEILKALYRKARVLILDEPTTFLTPQEIDTLFEILKSLAASGLTIILITHKLRDAMYLGHRLTVMRAGRVVATLTREEATEDILVQQLMGDSHISKEMLEENPPCLDTVSEEILLEISGLATKGGKDHLGLQGIDLQLAAGEIHGIAGITGSGQQELVEVLMGVVPVASGTIRLNGKDITSSTIAQRIKAGLCLIPQDRLRDGILPNMSLWETLVLGLHRQLFPCLSFRTQEAIELGRKAIAEYEIKSPHVNVQTAYLSGGNIQKVLVARAVTAAKRQPHPVVIAANPTKGLDIRTVHQVHKYLRQIAQEGGAVLLLSEDLDELMGNCHRISVLYRGSLVAQFSGPNYNRYEIGQAMLGKTRI